MERNPIAEQLLKELVQELKRVKEELVKINAREDAKLEVTP